MTMASEKKAAGGIGEVFKILVQALLLALVFRIVLFQPFSIPSTSMMPTLLINDYVFVSKYAYGYSRHSFPYSLAPFEGRIWAEAPERGDVAVFKLPSDGATDYIKRVIGLPGDRIQMIGGVLHINGEPVRRERIEDFTGADPLSADRPVAAWRETLPNGVSYVTLDLRTDGYGDDTQEFLVPAGYYFMMGDNRDNSIDSRFPNEVGMVPFENFVGRAEVIFFSIDEDSAPWELWTWPTDLRLDRFFRGL
jgi:signal peptidase I